MSSLALEAIVEGLNNHHLLEMSQREFQPQREGSDKVSFKVPSPHEVSEFQEQDPIVCVQLSTQPVHLALAILPLNSTGVKLAKNTIASPPDQLVCIYENGLAAGILRDIKFSTKENRKEEICAGNFRWISSPPLKIRIHNAKEKFSSSPGSPGTGKCPQPAFLELGAWSLLGLLTTTPVISTFPDGLATVSEHKPKIDFFHTQN